MGVAKYRNKRGVFWAVDSRITKPDGTQVRFRMKGIPTKEWWHERRQDLIDGKMPFLIRKMYNESLGKGEHWPEEFRDFWCLPERFTFEED